MLSLLIGCMKFYRFHCDVNQQGGARGRLKYALVQAIITRMEQHLTLP